MSRIRPWARLSPRCSWAAPHPLGPIIMGLVAAFAGYTSVFALNDVIDLKVDREKMAKYRASRETFDLDSLGQRHPLAQDSLSYGAGIAWVLVWGLLSLVLAFLLRPICAGLLVGAVILETAYCKLLRVTHWKGLLSGLMVGVGGLAGVWAVTPSPRPGMVILFFAWAFAWEVGGRNIPNDWSDLEEDRHLGIRTVPVRYGRKAASIISFVVVCATALLGLLFPLVVPMPNGWAYAAAALVVSVIFFFRPRYQMAARTERRLGPGLLQHGLLLSDRDIRGADAGRADLRRTEIPKRIPAGVADRLECALPRTIVAGDPLITKSARCSIVATLVCEEFSACRGGIYQWSKGNLPLVQGGILQWSRPTLSVVNFLRDH